MLWESPTDRIISHRTTARVFRRLLGTRVVSCIHSQMSRCICLWRVGRTVRQVSGTFSQNATRDDQQLKFMLCPWPISLSRYHPRWKCSYRAQRGDIDSNIVGGDDG